MKNRKRVNKKLSEDDKLIQEALNRVLEKTKKGINLQSLGSWLIGKAISKEVDKLPPHLRIRFLVKVSFYLGTSPETIKKYIKFYNAVPDLPERIKETGISAYRWRLIWERGLLHQLTSHDLERIAKLTQREFISSLPHRSRPRKLCRFCGEASDHTIVRLRLEEIPLCSKCLDKLFDCWAIYANQYNKYIKEKKKRYMSFCPKCNLPMEKMEDSFFGQWYCVRCDEYFKEDTSIVKK